MYNTIEQALETKKAVVLSIKEYNHNGEDRKLIRAKKANGKRSYMVVQYGNGLFSSTV